MIYGNWEESYAKLRKVLGALQSCILGTMIAAQTKSCLKSEKWYPAKKMLKRVFWPFGPCINGFAYCKLIVQVDGTWFHEKYTGTLLIATTRDDANHSRLPTPS